MFSKNILLIAISITFVVVFQSCKPLPKEEINHKMEFPLMGSWTVASIHWITKDTTYSIEKAQPGKLLFTPNSYAIIWTPMEEARTPFANLSEPTDEEAIAGFKSIVFNSGSYEFTDSTLITTAEIAKVPGFEKGKQFYKYQLDGDSLALTMYDELYPDGTRPKWYGKYQTKFILYR